MTLSQCKELLFREGYTLVAADQDAVYTDRRRGVEPLLALYDSGVRLAAGVAADRVVGRAAAYLYVLLGVKQLYAAVLSDAAAEVLLTNGISFVCDTRVPAIKNRQGDGFCPMESATRHLSPADSTAALAAIRATKARLTR